MAWNSCGLALAPSAQIGDSCDAVFKRLNGEGNYMFELIAAAGPTVEDVVVGQTQDSLVIGEQFYFFTVVLMWLIHAGFMSYEAASPGART